MPDTANIIAVIGAGIVGIACARALQRAGKTVTVFDPQPPGRGCSYGNAGHIAIDHVRPLARLDVLAGVPRMLFDPLGPLTLRWSHLPRALPWLMGFARAALPVREKAGTRALAGLLGISTAAWREELEASQIEGLMHTRGALLVYETDAAFAADEKSRAIQRAHGVELEAVSGEAARRLAPGLSDGVRHGVFYPKASHVVDPYGLVLALVGTFVRDGGTIEAAAATAVESANGRVTGVATSAGRHACDAVVLAAGLDSPRLLRPLGLRLPIQPERGYHLMIEESGVKFDIPLTSAESSFVITPMRHGLRLAGTVELAAADAPPNWERAEVLARHAKRLLPGLAGKPGERWMGLRPTLPDYLPAIGPVPGYPGLFAAFAHQHIGLTMAAATGRIIKDLVIGAPPPVDVGAFRPERFG